MTAYEFYYLDEKGKEHFIGILPERRKDPKRINRESIMKWIGMVLGDHTDIEGSNVYFVEVEV
jgi:hypothetical protein